MGMFSSAANAVTAVFDTIATTAHTAEKSINVATQWVDRRATSLDMTDKQYVATSTAQTLAKLQAELQADEEVAKIYEQIKDSF